MSDAEEAVGLVQIKVSPKAVHTAVRNILTNEMGLSREKVLEMLREKVLEMLRETVREVSEEKIQDCVLSHLRNNGWDGAQLYKRVKESMERQLDDLKPVVEKVSRELVHEVIREDVEGVVAGIIKDGLKVRLGWNRETRITVEPAPHAKRVWVAVEDRVPSDSKPILVYHGNSWNDGKEVSVATYADGEFLPLGDSRSSGDTSLVKVTHWRLFPDPPVPEV